MYTQRKDCRLCKGKLKPVISLGDIHLSTFLDTNDNPPPKIPLNLMECVDCTLMQLEHTVSGEAMYSDYWYQSGLNGSMVRALNDVVEKVFNRVALNANDIVVDIGANDGTLLSFYPNYLRRVGFEPSNLAFMARPKADVILNTYFNKQSFVEAFGAEKAKVITAIAMFYDLEDPHSFVQDLKDILADDGILIIQMMDLLSMLKYGDFPNICHEHLEYYSLDVFYNLMLKHGLEVYEVEYNGVNGGSLRAYIRHTTNDFPTPQLVDALFAENEFFDKLGDVGKEFERKVNEVRTKVVDFIRTENAAGKTIAVMGASTKGNTVLQYFGLNEKDIIHAAEINPDKFGKYTVGSNIPIISQQDSMRFFVDYYLILPWGFIDNLVARNQDYLKRGGTFIVPLPDPRLITMTKGGEVICTKLL